MADVYVSEALGDGCRALEDVYFFVGNRGGVDFEGQVIIHDPQAATGTATPLELRVDTGLGPGEVGELPKWNIQSMPVADVEISIELLDEAGSPVTDCDGGNHVARIVSGCSCN
jgi:hypothetical protein